MDVMADRLELAGPLEWIMMFFYKYYTPAEFNACMTGRERYQ
jgi:hypothetical protein